ncbi:MAG TPA: hypothetical protein VNJ01_05125 [Bacteriovoracaceae bacterium]|nr:hypothetical protein [Bacteriovoracaceae bacterium]
MKVTFFFLFLAVSCAQLPAKRTDKLSILQGITNSKEVEFSILAPKSLPLRFELRSAEGEILTPDDSKLESRDFSSYGVHKLVFIRDPQKVYNLYVFEGEKILDQRLVGKGQPAPSKLKIAVASCLDDYFEEHFKIWDQVNAADPDYLLLIGDNVYADKASKLDVLVIDEEKLWKRYIDARLRIPLYFQVELIPTHAVWDDHDYGANDGASDFKYKEASKKIFDAFFAQDLSDDDWVDGYGVGGLLSLGDFNLYFLDGRTYRSRDKDGTHLGLEQKSWLTAKLLEEPSPSLLVKGDQFFGGYHQFDSYEGDQPKEFVQFVSELRGVPTPFVFLSGDRHMSEIMQFPRGLFGKPSFEITSSPLHARIYDGLPDSNPWRVVSEKKNVNFTIIDNVVKDNHWFMDVQNIGQDGRVHYRRELAVFIKDLQNNLNEVRKRRQGRRRYKKIRSRRRR